MLAWVGGGSGSRGDSPDRAGPLRAAALAASPVAAMIRRLSLNEMDLQRTKQMGR
jgi:hypothetical protein